jgi:haloalkane dehalogenase
VVEGVVAQLGLREITLMVQDWGGPIGFWVATRHPEWFRAFVIGNTWAWPMRGERSTEWFSKALGSSVLGGLLVRRADVFVNVFMRAASGARSRPGRAADVQAPPSHPHSRVPVQVMPREILAAHQLLAEVKQGLGRLADKPASHRLG